MRLTSCRAVDYFLPDDAGPFRRNTLKKNSPICLSLLIVGLARIDVEVGRQKAENCHGDRLNRRRENRDDRVQAAYHEHHDESPKRARCEDAEIGLHTCFT